MSDQPEKAVTERSAPAGAGAAFGADALVEASPAGVPGGVLPLTGRGGLLSCGISNTATQSQVRDEGPYVDWLTVAQVFDSAPMVGSTLLIFADLATGEFQSQAVRGMQFEGSHDSRLMVRSDGRRVEVSGNPSRFGRRDNVFGLTSIDQCIDLYNWVLRALQLPEFFLDDRTTLGGHQLQKVSDTTVADYGCRIKRLDLCEVYETGSLEDGRASIRALGSVTYLGKAGFVYPDGNTVSWGQGSRYSYSKYYLKGPELRKHLNQSDDYSKALADWACERGIIRHEVSLKAMNLRRNGLDQPAAWSGERMREVMRAFRCHDKAGLSASSYAAIADELLELGVPASRARRAQEAAYAYLAGHQFIIGDNISRSAYYRLRGDLKRVGLDIGAPLNVSALRHSIREVEWRPALPPPFYQRTA